MPIREACPIHLMRGHRPTRYASLSILLLLLLACSQKRATPDLTLDKALTGNLNEEQLEAAGFSQTAARLLVSELSPDVYKYCSVSQYTDHGQTFLKIDQYNMENWTNSKTGETGASPHGTITEFVLRDGKWSELSGMHYQ